MNQPNESAPLVIVVGSYAPSLINFRKDLIVALLAGGNRVLAVAPDITLEIKTELEALGATTEIVPINRRSMNPITDFTTLVSLWWLFRKHRPTLVLPYTAKPVIYGGIAARLANVPHLVPWITGLGFAFGEDKNASLLVQLVRGAARWLYRTSLAGASHVFFQNSDDQREFFNRKLTWPTTATSVTAGSGLDIKKYPHFPAKTPVQPLRFVLIARLLRDKGVADFVEAAHKVKARGLQAAFRVVGPADPGPTAIDPATIAKWRAEDIVEFRDEVADVVPVLAETDVFVLPSYREGRPRSAMEALAVGRPLILTDVPGCRETVIPGQTGLLVPVMNPIALADAMEDFISHPERIMSWGGAARRDAETRFDVKKVNQQILATLTDLGAIREGAQRGEG